MAEGYNFTGDGVVEAERGRLEGGGGGGSLEATGLLTQEADPGGTTLYDAGNGFNKLIRLEIIWKVCHCWPVGARFALN